ncbi:hypothetical protein [Magnetospirillum molischianum]|uniref:Uncharacterized protein n=1 Tax=Magnetospirillum molischianum DSM 120 TaxID=1150626 RepID=H8FQX0_MAGML|nr:hypothetical protein [Magnetospirillum molischianum]CCG40758.1 conserved hypothetical protein [Magnetospirillum molischianum DSM 120]
MDISAIGTKNTATYLPRAQADLDGPYGAAKQQETTAQVLAQSPPLQLQQAQQAQAQQTPPLATTPPGKGSVGQVLDVSA